jgi:hypothetical protein
MFCPAVALAGPVLVMPRSETAVIVVVTVAVLFPGMGSFAGDVAVAVFVIGPAAAGAFAVMVIGGADAPTPRAGAAVLGHVQVTVLPEIEHVQNDPAAVGDVTPAGSVSIMVRLPTVAGPLFVTVTV